MTDAPDIFSEPFDPAAVRENMRINRERKGCVCPTGLSDGTCPGPERCPYVENVGEVE